MKIVSVSSKNQITIPNELLLALNVMPRSKLIIEKKDRNMILRPIKTSIVDELAGSLTKYVHPSKLGVPLEKAKRIAMDAMVKDLASRL